MEDTCRSLTVHQQDLCGLQDQDKRTAALRDFNDRIVACSAVHATIVPIGDGLALCRKL